MKRNILKKALMCIGYMIPAVFASSCIEEFNADLGGADTNILVIEGNILSDTICDFHLSKSAGINEDAYPAILGVTNAQIRIVGSDGATYKGIHAGEGLYQIQTGQLASDVKYSLEIEWDGATFTSDPTVPLDAPEIAKVRADQPDPDGNINLLVSNNTPGSSEPQYFRWTFTDYWEVHSKFRPIYEYDPKTRRIVDLITDRSVGWNHSSSRQIIIANSKKFQNNQIKDFRIAEFTNSDLRFQTLYCIDVKQFAMTRAQYEYELARQELSDQMGGMFAPQPSELFSNIKSSDKQHRAIGYIGVCSKPSTYRLWVSRGEVRYTDLLFRNIEITDDEDVLAMSNQEKYEAGFRVANSMPAFMVPWDWVSANGVDVSFFGCSYEKPSFWP